MPDELGKGEVDEDDPPRQNVDAEIGVNHDQEKARQEGPGEKTKDFHETSVTAKPRLLCP